jgi:hypothetical protein
MATALLEPGELKLRRREGEAVRRRELLLQKNPPLAPRNR